MELINLVKLLTVTKEWLLGEGVGLLKYNQQTKAEKTLAWAGKKMGG